MLSLVPESLRHGRNHHILWGGHVQYWTNTNLSPPIIGLLYCNMWHMICPPFMNPGCSLVDLLLFPIYFQFRKNKGNKTVWPPPLDCTLGWARKRRLAASFEKNAGVTDQGVPAFPTPLISLYSFVDGLACLFFSIWSATELKKKYLGEGSHLDPPNIYTMVTPLPCATDICRHNTIHTI